MTRLTEHDQQQDLQRVLHLTEQTAGLSAALERLFTWSVDAGYFREGIFDANDLFHFPDTDSRITFRAQINRTRTGYVAPGQERSGCPICFSEVNSPGKPLLRAYEFPLGISATPYFAQLTPFPLRPRHFIVIQKAHSPMRVERASVEELIDFVHRAPNFTACSNSDVRNAGVSILDHHHYQVFADYELPVMEASALKGMGKQSGGVMLELLDYPLTTLRLAGNRLAVVDAGSQVISGWKALDPGRNTCNMTVRNRDGKFELYLFFRNPDHVTPPDLLRIKAEGVGVVEASGEGIFPAPEDAVLEEIRQNGLGILKRILRGLNPVPPEDRAALFRTICKWVAEERPRQNT